MRGGEAVDEWDPKDIVARLRVDYMGLPTITAQVFKCEVLTYQFLIETYQDLSFGNSEPDLLFLGLEAYSAVEKLVNPKHRPVSHINSARVIVLPALGRWAFMVTKGRATDPRYNGHFVVPEETEGG